VRALIVQLLQHVDLKLGGIAVLVHVAYDLQRPSLAVSSLCHAHTHTNTQYVYLYYSKVAAVLIAKGRIVAATYGITEFGSHLLPATRITGGR